MNIIIHNSQTRGYANHGWLISNHTFSFADYYDPSRMNFGALRVLNDDMIAGGTGFGTHGHKNMEIISIPLSGSLMHRDNMGNTTIIETDEVQIMSAGTGVLHSEHNASADNAGQFLQIWISPREINITPRYQQMRFEISQNKNKLHTIVSPTPTSETLLINQNATLSMGVFDDNVTFNYKLSDSANGVYVFVIEGGFEIIGNPLSKRDGLGIYDIETIGIRSTVHDSQILIIEIPMTRVLI